MRILSEEKLDDSSIVFLIYKTKYKEERRARLPPCADFFSGRRQKKVLERGKDGLLLLCYVMFGVLRTWWWQRKIMTVEVRMNTINNNKYTL